MSRYRVLIQPRAEAEALAAFDWIAGHSPDAADRWLSGLRKAVAKLADHPMLHPLAVEASERFGIPIREALYGKRRSTYRILFTVEGDVIRVLAVRHSAQDELQP
jgi:plasmid stabilization system protein ParE